MILLDGFSKAYAMTGWRLGYGVMPAPTGGGGDAAADQLDVVHGELHAARRVEALTGPQDAVDAMVAEFRRRRDVIVAGLNRIPGFRCADAARRVLRVPEHHRDREEVEGGRRMLLDEAGVASLAGTAFGAAGEGFVRFSYANSVENIRTALGKMSALFA